MSGELIKGLCERGGGGRDGVLGGNVRVSVRGSVAD